MGCPRAAVVRGDVLTASCAGELREGVRSMDGDTERQQRILVAEDDADLSETLCAVLDDYGYGVETAASLEEALALVDRSSFGFILSDLFTGQGADRLHAVEQLRERAFPTPVGLVTGWKVSELEAVSRGFAWVLQKPFDIDKLVTEIAAHVELPLDAERERQAHVVRAYFAALSARDWNALVGLCADDVTYVLPPPAPFAQEIHGKEAFRRYTEETYAHFPGARFEEPRVYALPRGMAARYVGRWPAEGEMHQQAGAVIFQFEGERIKQIGVRLNAEQLRALVG